jgi:hypothetical protein
MLALKKLWRKFDHGDHLTNSELEQLRKSAQQGEIYLAARGERLALFKTRCDLVRIEDYLAARERG